MASHIKRRILSFLRIGMKIKGIKFHIALLAVTFIVIGEASYLMISRFDSNLDESSAVSFIMEKCGNASYKPTCYENEIPKLMDKISMEDAFKVTARIQDEDQSYRYCHVLGHKLASRETAKDPNSWQEVIQRCPSGVCSNGCIHGAFQERFRKESLTPEELEEYKPLFASVCEKRIGFSPTGIEQASCYHALGHLFMYVTDANIDKSLGLCRELAIKGERDYRQLCYDGSFMQIFQPLEPDDFSLIEGKEVKIEEVKGFCAAYDGQERGSCWSESWPLFRDELQDPKNVIAHCGYLPDIEEKRCFSALMYVMTAQMGFDRNKVTSYCAAMPASYRGNCFAQAASRIIETDYRNGEQAVSLCVESALYDRDSLCFKELLKYSTYNFRVGSDEFVSFCRTMPGEWMTKCLKGREYGNAGKAIAE